MAPRSPLRCLLDRDKIRRVAPTGRQHAAAAASGPKQPAQAVQPRCQARLAEFGCGALDESLPDR